MSFITKWLLGLLVYTLFLTSCAGTKSRPNYDPTSTKIESPTKSINKKALIIYAEKFIDVPYKYGGNNPKEGFDCSGYVKYVYKHFQINVPRITRDYESFGTRIKMTNAQIGDLILFSLYDDKKTIGHIGIICSIEHGNIKFLHAASGAKSRRVIESELKGVHLSRMLFITRVLP
ncbi:MAG TPA: C40 family peptidase [Edaphocola sp.]|nr:C40 family peptidase [Edaphocola sp.]